MSLAKVYIIINLHILSLCGKYNIILIKHFLCVPIHLMVTYDGPYYNKEASIKLSSLHPLRCK
jgi:hypothetical protein